MDFYKGGCSFWSVRFALSDHPLWVLACHCDACKKRTGSAYGVSLVVENKSVKEFTGETRTYTRVGDSGNKVSYEFCPNCATTLRWHVDIVPNRQVFAGGALDSMKGLKVIAEMYTDEAVRWAILGCELSRPNAPDDGLRKLMIAKAAASRQQ